MKSGRSQKIARMPVQAGIRNLAIVPTVCFCILCLLEGATYAVAENGSDHPPQNVRLATDTTADREAQREAIRVSRNAKGGTQVSNRSITEHPNQKIQRLTQAINSGTLSDDDMRQTLRERAYLYATTGRLGSAHQDLKIVLRMEPRDDRAYYIQGLAYFGVSPKNAIRSFSQAIRLQPKFVDGYRGRAWANLLAENYSDAVDDFTQVLRMEPDDSEAYRGRGWAQLQAIHYDHAILDFTELKRFSPANPEATLGRGLAYYFTGRMTEARQDFLSTMRFRPTLNSARTYNNLRFDDWRRHQRVTALLSKQTQRHPRDVDAWLATSVVGYRQLDDPGLSTSLSGKATFLSSISQVLKFKPDDIDALMFRAIYYSTPLVSYSRQAAIADLSEVIRLQPTNAEAYFRRALLRAIDKEELLPAIDDCEKAVALSPGDPTLGTVLNKLKADQRAWEQAKQRAAIAQEQRKVDSKEAEIIFMSGLAVIFANYLANYDPSTPAPDRNDQWLRDWETDLLLDIK